MTMVCFFIFSLFASIASGANYVYCGTNSTAIGSPRPLPIQGVSLTTGKVVVGLPYRSRIEIADCGWYEVAPIVKPTAYSNEVYRISGWKREDLQAIAVFSKSFKAIKPVEYSKRLLYRELDALGVWESVKAYLEAQGLWEDFILATTLESDDPLLQKALEALPSAAGLDKNTLAEILSKCVVK